MKQSILFIVSIMLPALLAPVPARAQHPLNTELEVRDLEARRFRAMTERDVPALERLLSGDLVYTHASGWRQTKAEFLAALLVTGRASGKVRSKGQELNVELLYLEAYVKQDGRWQLAAWESTRLAP